MQIIHNYSPPIEIESYTQSDGSPTITRFKEGNNKIVVVELVRNSGKVTKVYTRKYIMKDYYVKKLWKNCEKAVNI